MSTLDGDNSPQASSSSRLSLSMSMPRIRSNTTLNVAHTPSASPTINNGAKINSALQYPEKAGRASPLPAATAGGAGASSVPPPPQPVNTVALVLLFVAALCVMIMLFRNFPTVAESDKALLKFPRSLSDVRSLSGVLRKYRDENLEVVVAGFCAIYIFLQSFAIPGAIFLSILAGPLFGVWRGLLIVSVVATSGSCVCYTVSYYLGRGLVERFFPAMLGRLRGMVSAQRGNLFFYLLFLRISPLLPNWFISVSAPILDIPLLHFAAATFFGLMPANYLHVTTGIKLEELESADADAGSPVNLRALAFLFGIAFLALLPTIFKSKFEQLAGGAADGAALTSDSSATGTAAASSTNAASSQRINDADAPPSSRTRSSNKKKAIKAQ